MDEINAITIGNNITYMLNASGKMQRDLADACGVSVSTVSSWSLGKRAPRPDKWAAICEFFGCTLSELMQERKNHYLRQDAEELAQFLYDNPDYHTVFDAVRGVKKEDLEFVKDFIDRLKR
jgi:transcriptional regulator with XRE-family HTH domain